MSTMHWPISPGTTDCELNTQWLLNMSVILKRHFYEHTNYLMGIILHVFEPLLGASHMITQKFIFGQRHGRLAIFPRLSTLNRRVVAVAIGVINIAPFMPTNMELKTRILYIGLSFTTKEFYKNILLR